MQNMGVLSQQRRYWVNYAFAAASVEDLLNLYLRLDQQVDEQEVISIFEFLGIEWVLPKLRSGIVKKRKLDEKVRMKAGKPSKRRKTKKKK